jgi:hypothetical protein
MLYESTYYGVACIGDDSLQHHGIKGQKWGIRRFQNPDGTLTPLSKQRYGTVENFNDVRNKRKATAKKVGKVALSAASTYLTADMMLGGPLSRKLQRSIMKRSSRKAFRDPFEDYVITSKKTGKIVNMEPVENIVSKRNAKNRQRITSYINSVAKNARVDLSSMTMDDLRKLDLY